MLPKRHHLYSTVIQGTAFIPPSLAFRPTSFDPVTRRKAPQYQGPALIDSTMLGLGI